MTVTTNAKNLRQYDNHIGFRFTAQKIKFSIKHFFSKCDQIENCRFGHIY